MARFLAFDLGKRRTGVAFYDDAAGIPLPLSTLTSSGDEELVAKIADMIRVRSADRIVIGLPLLPSGNAGEQARWVRSIVHRLKEAGYDALTLDERYTTPRNTSSDADASAALSMLQTAVARGLSNS